MAQVLSLTPVARPVPISRADVNREMLETLLRVIDRQIVSATPTDAVPPTMLAGLREWVAAGVSTLVTTQGEDAGNLLYASRAGAKCPVCASEGMHRGEVVRSEEGALHRDVECATCSSTWTDVLTITNVLNLVDNS